jgi:hypothetical protein
MVNNSQWSNVQIIIPTLTFNVHNVPQYRRCFWHKGVIANWIVERTSAITNRVYADPICDECKDKWSNYEDLTTKAL